MKQMEQPRVQCAECGITSRHQKYQTFVRHGWRIQDNGYPICPMCSDFYEQSERFKKYLQEVSKHVETKEIWEI